MAMAGRTYRSKGYRYGFNGKENDSDGEWGRGLIQDYGFRLYNPAASRFLSVDPLRMSFPWNSVYAFAENSPICNIDLEGLEKFFAADGSYIGKYGKNTEIRIVKDQDLPNIKAFFSDPKAFGKNRDAAIFIMGLNAVEGHLNTMENELKVFESWALKYTLHKDISKNEFAMSLFKKTLTDGDGKKIEVFVEGSVAKGDDYEPGYSPSVSPDDSNSPFYKAHGWGRYSTIHTHPRGGWKAFSGDLGALSGKKFDSDGGWVLNNNLRLYLMANVSAYQEHLNIAVLDPIELNKKVSENPDCCHNGDDFEDTVQSVARLAIMITDRLRFKKK